MAKIPYTKPSIGDLEIKYANDAVTTGWGDNCYTYLKRFEEDFCRHLGVKHAIATSSCTGALHLGLAALGIGEGDEVIIADSNWIASAAPVLYLGARPVFVDILPDSWCIDPKEVEKAISKRTKLIMAVHLYGNLCAMDELLALGETHGIAVVEDAAEAIGSVYQGRKAGSLGKFGTFSFHGTKTITTGEGGMFVTNDIALYQKVLTLSNHGRSVTQTKQFWPDTLGYKFKMSNVQAAIGVAQLERVDELVARKREIFYRYRDLLKECEQISLNAEPANVQIGAWMPTVVFSHESGVTREALQAAFALAGIDARVFFYPLSTMPFIENSVGQPNAVDIAARAINLPSYHDMTESDQLLVVGVLKSLLGNSK